MAYSVWSFLLGRGSVQKNYPKITSQPADVTVAAGERARFSVVADGDDLTYQWQYSADGGETWSKSTYTSATSATLSMTAQAGWDGYLYRCVISTSSGNATASAPATLTVT